MKIGEEILKGAAGLCYAAAAAWLGAEALDKWDKTHFRRKAERKEKKARWKAEQEAKKAAEAVK